MDKLTESWRALLVWWLLLAALLAAVVLLSGSSGSRAWMASRVGEDSWLPQIKGVSDLLRQWSRPKVDTADDRAIVRTVDSPYGLNTFLHHEVGQARREAAIRIAAQAGFTHLRQPMPWEDVEIHGARDFEDRRNFPARSAWYKYDNIVALAKAENLQVIFRLDDPPAWAIGDEETLGSQAPPQDIREFAYFAGQVASHFRDRVRHYQIWNEPNIHPEWGNQPVSPEAYAILLKSAATAIREADPEAVIVLAAMASTTTYTGDSRSGGGLNDLVYLDRLYRAGAAPFFDVLAVQGYGLWSGPMDRRMHPLVINFGRVQFVRDLMVRHRDSEKPIWISEMNWNAVPEHQDAPFGRVSLALQARNLPLAYERIKEWPWLELANVWYLKRAEPDWEEKGDPQAHFRLMTYDGVLMPAYWSMKAYLHGSEETDATSEE